MVYDYQPAEMFLLSLRGTAFEISLFLNMPYWKQKQLGDIFDRRRTLCGRRIGEKKKKKSILGVIAFMYSNDTKVFFTRSKISGFS